MKQLSVLDLFSGLGMFSRGLEKTGGFETRAFCEIDPHCVGVLNRFWPDVPVFDDITRLRGADVGSIDVITGGFPCQDISYAGPGNGLSGERSGLWFEYARLVRELGPQLVLVENVSALLSRGMGEVLGTLADLGFDAEWSVVPACSLGYTHMRRRVFIVAYSDRFDGRARIRDTLARAFGSLSAIGGFEGARARQKARMANPSALYRGADGAREGRERNRALGNSIVSEIPQLIGTAILDSLNAAPECPGSAT